MHAIEKAGALLCAEYRKALERFEGEQPEEIRLRLGYPPQLLCGERERTLADRAVTEEDLLRLLEVATAASVHTAAQALAGGYVSYRGLRIGLCGTGVLREGRLSGFRAYSSAVIRIPSQRRGLCDSFFADYLRAGAPSMLLLAPPGGGKTTLLRELIRRLSEEGWRLGVVDERNELAAVDGARAQFDLGPRTDLLTGLPKPEGAMLLLRSMNVQIIAMDEISSEADLRAAVEIAACGVRLLASAHARDRRELERRELYKWMLDKGVFSALLCIRGAGEERSYTLTRI